MKAIRNRQDGRILMYTDVLASLPYMEVIDHSPEKIIDVQAKEVKTPAPLKVELKKKG